MGKNQKANHPRKARTHVRRPEPAEVERDLSCNVTNCEEKAVNSVPMKTDFGGFAYVARCASHTSKFSEGVIGPGAAES